MHVHTIIPTTTPLGALEILFANAYRVIVKTEILQLSLAAAGASSDSFFSASWAVPFSSLRSGDGEREPDLLRLRSGDLDEDRGLSLLDSRERFPRGDPKGLRLERPLVGEGDRDRPLGDGDLLSRGEGEREYERLRPLGEGDRESLLLLGGDRLRGDQEGEREYERLRPLGGDLLPRP